MSILLSKKRWLYIITTLLLSIYIFLVSIVLSKFYTQGDQFIYNSSYESIKGLNFVDAFLNYQFYINSVEPIHFFITWVFSNIYLPKDLVMSISNVFLGIILIKILYRWNVHLFVISILISTNFYLYVLYFAAERLKFAFIFLFFSYYYFGHTIKKYFYLFISVLSHVQIIIFPLILFFTNARNFFSRNNFILKFFLLVPILIGLLFYLLNHLLFKFGAYYEMASTKGIFVNTWQVFFLMICTLFYTNKRFQVFLIFGILSFFSALLGPERITMIAFIFFMSFSLKIKRGINLGVAISSFYYGLKTFLFIYNIINFNNGFAE